MTVSAVYRVRQFLSAWAARVSPGDLREVNAVLPPDAQKLFRAMRLSDQQHSIDVMRTLRRQGHGEQELLAAALLHDVGKSAAWLTPVHRALIVLSKRLAPPAFAWLTHGEPRGWRKPFIIHLRHPDLGAQWAAQAGCSPLTVRLIRRHQEPLRGEPANQEEQWLAALQQADGIN